MEESKWKRKEGWGLPFQSSRLPTFLLFLLSMIVTSSEFPNFSEVAIFMLRVLVGLDLPPLLGPRSVAPRPA